MTKPATQYARSGDLHIAFQIFGDADLDLVLVRGHATHMDLSWEWPGFRRIMDRLGAFARVILFDKRGTGLSDPVDDVPSLEERMDDVRAVMDAAGSDRAALWGFSEGGAMAMLFAATHPDRTSHLMLYSTIVRTTWAPDYPLATPADSLIASMKELIVPEWGRGTNIEVWIPSLADDPQAAKRWGKYERQAASPGMFMRLNRMFLDVDVRHILPTIRVPTLVLHRRGDRVVNIAHGRYVADRIPHARFVELPGIDHALEAGDTEIVLDHVEQFLTGRHRVAEHNRVLATVMFTDLVGSTQRAASVGDTQWLDLLGAHQLAVQNELDRFRGHEVKRPATGFWRPSTARPGLSDAARRSSKRSNLSALRCGWVFTRERSKPWATTLEASPFTSPPASGTRRLGPSARVRDRGGHRGRLRGRLQRPGSV